MGCLWFRCAAFQRLWWVKTMSVHILRCMRPSWTAVSRVFRVIAILAIHFSIVRLLVVSAILFCFKPLGDFFGVLRRIQIRNIIQIPIFLNYRCRRLEASPTVVGLWYYCTQIYQVSLRVCELSQLQSLMRSSPCVFGRGCCRVGNEISPF